MNTRHLAPPSLSGITIGTYRMVGNTVCGGDPRCPYGKGCLHAPTSSARKHCKNRGSKKA